jgi:predicted ATPase
MAVSKEVRRLKARWETGTGWPKRLDWIEIGGLRGWEGQRFNLNFPIMAVVGENGVGKSTVLQCAASVYRSETTPPKDRFASDFFPDTTWDHILNARIGYAVREAGSPHVSTIRKPGERWRGNPERRQRRVEYIDLTRIQPVPARVGYTKLANPSLLELTSNPFEKGRLGRLSEIMGRTYDLAKMAMTSADAKRAVPVISQQGAAYSGFHQGAGETTVTELLQADIPQYSLVLIDEIESSLHPRAQRRLIRDLAERCREGELQIILTTHSPYVLEELPPEARAYILQAPTGRREIVYGVSADFAMTKMDDVPHTECDLYVEDRRAEAMLTEILVHGKPDLVHRCRTIPYGASSVGRALGEMVANRRFPRPSCVYLDGDEGAARGCLTLPGEDAPERVVFEALRERHWNTLDTRTGRPFSKIADACAQAMTISDHHEWVDRAATALVLGGDILWQAMCAAWATQCVTTDDAKTVIEPIEDALIGVGDSGPAKPPEPVLTPITLPAGAAEHRDEPIEPEPLF